MADEAKRRGFMIRAPELRAALVAELGPLVETAPLGDAEKAVLRQILEHAGFGEGGKLTLASYAVLWGGDPSWVPAVPLPEEVVRAAVRVLKRRGVLATAATGADSSHVVVVLEHDALRALR